MNTNAIGKTIADAIKGVFLRKRRKDRQTPGAVSAWEAMILQEAGPMRSEPIRAFRHVDLGPRK